MPNIKLNIDETDSLVRNLSKIKQQSEDEIIMIPQEIAEWIEHSKEDVIDYEVNKLKSLGLCSDSNSEALEAIQDTSTKCGINQLNIFRCLLENADCGIGQWMKNTSN